MLAARDAAAAYQRRDMARVFQTARRRRANLCLHVAGESDRGWSRLQSTQWTVWRGGIGWAAAVSICLIGSWWRALRGAHAWFSRG